MDTLSRDSSSSNSSILPFVGVGAGVLALILAIVGLVKINSLNKIVAGQADEVAKISTIQNDVHAAAAKSENDLKQLRDGVQGALTQVGDQIGAMKAQIAHIEEMAKKPAPAAGGKGKGGGVVTGTVDADGNYVVAPGDTVNKIAKKFATTARAIEDENPGLEPSKLRVGQKVKIPKK